MALYLPGTEKSAPNCFSKMESSWFMQLEDPELRLASDTTGLRATITRYQGLITFCLSALFSAMLASEAGSMAQENYSSFRSYISQI